MFVHCLSERELQSAIFYSSFLGFLGPVFAINDRFNVDTFFSTSAAQQKKIFDHSRAPVVHSISNSVDIQVLRMFPHFDFCITEYLRLYLLSAKTTNIFFEIAPYPEKIYQRLSLQFPSHSLLHRPFRTPST